jgi:hypothetical protein
VTNINNNLVIIRRVDANALPGLPSLPIDSELWLHRQRTRPSAKRYCKRPSRKCQKMFVPAKKCRECKEILENARKC